MIRLNKAFYLIGSGLLLTAAFIYLSPSFVSSSLVFPVRYDSLYIVYRSGLSGNEDPGQGAEFNPADLSLGYSEFTVVGGDSCLLHGWFVAADDTSSDRSLLLLHDINKSKISLLESIRQFHDRGFNVFTYDLRAHGRSGGKEFSLGLKSIRDLDAVIRTLRFNGYHRIAVMGTGLSCPVVYMYLLSGGTCDAVILESPFNNLAAYLHRHAETEWGGFASLWYPVLERQISEQLQMPVYQLDLRAISAMTKTPTLVVAGTADELVNVAESYEVYENCAAPQKDLLLVKQARHGELAARGGEYYYNGISSFVNTVMPRRQKSSGRKRLALSDDLQGNDRPHPRDRTH
ncbi:MAG: hypothetical protein RL213_1272 [Bacteroidota bacterium]|jgi:alpha-beta hydrolase superfamily lysophospholipase